MSNFLKMLFEAAHHIYSVLHILHVQAPYWFAFPMIAVVLYLTCDFIVSQWRGFWFGVAKFAGFVGGFFIRAKRFCTKLASLPEMAKQAVIKFFKRLFRRK